MKNPRPWSVASPVSLLCLLAVLSPTRAPAQDQGASRSETRAGASEGQSELLRIHEMIRRVDERALETRRAQTARLRELESQKTAAKRVAETLADEVSRLTTELAKREADLAATKSRTDAIRSGSGELLASLRSWLTQVGSAIEDGIPWQQDLRLQSVQSAQALLETERPSPAAILAAIGRVQKEEESLARLVETGAVRMEVDGQTKELAAFHLGLLAVIYASEDGKIRGFSRAGESLEHGRSAAEDQPESAEGYVLAVDILRRRRTPALVDIYLPPAGPRR